MKLLNRITEFFKRRRVAKARKLWVDALLSGDYEQTVGSLNVNNQFCCLGVACDLYQKHIGGLEIGLCNGYDLHGNGVVRTAYDREAGYLPVKVAQWLDITFWGDLAEPEGSFKHLAACNDSGMTFNDVARLIETKPLKPFGSDL